MGHRVFARLLHLAMLCLLAALTTPLHAQLDSIRVSFALSGGISNGSYQAGVLSASVAFMRAANQGRLATWNTPRFSIAGTTGASAGSINSLAVPLSFCADKDVAVTKGLLWNLWIPVGFSQLLSDEQLPDSGVFSRRFFQQELFAPLYSALEAARCQSPVFLGFTMTRERALEVELGKSGLSIPVQRTVSGFWLDSAGLRQFSVPELADSRFGLTAHVDIDRPDSSLVQVILASSAFPVAFAPVTLAFHRTTHDGRVVRDSARFLDGGVFENDPLSLLRVLSSADTIRQGQRWVVAVAPGFRDSTSLSANLRLRGSLATPRTPRGRRSAPQRRADGLSAFARSVVPTGRSYELSLLLRDTNGDDFFRTVQPTRRHAATFGPTLGGFGAFASRSMREYDFMQGLSDGLRYAAKHWTCRDPNARRNGECVPRSAVDSVAFSAAAAIPELASDSSAMQALRLILAGDSATDTSLRTRTMSYYIGATPVMDIVQRDTAFREATCIAPEGLLCQSGLSLVLDGLNRTLGEDVAKAAAGCIWDQKSLKWDSSACADDGFFEGAERRWNVFDDHGYANIMNWLERREYVLDKLLDRAALLAFQTTGRPSQALRGAWWAARTSVLPPNNVLAANRTVAIGIHPLRQLLSPYRVSLLTPTNEGLPSTTRVSWSLLFGQLSYVRVEFLQAGFEFLTHSAGSPNHCTVFTWKGDENDRCFAFLGSSLGFDLSVVALDFGGIWRGTSRLNGIGRSTPVFARATVLGAVVVGAEYGQSASFGDASRGLRVSVGLNDLSGLFWLLTGK